jgi:hypothetical protein
VARLFVSPRDAQFISDVTKELMKDVVGAKIYFYRVIHELTQINETYNEAKEIIYDDPISIDVFIKFSNQEVKTGAFGKEKYKELEIHFHHEDLLDRDITPREGDIVAWGDNFYEIFETTKETELWGLVEFEIGLQVQAKQVQFGAIQSPLQKPVGKRNKDFDSMDGSNWQQSRGKDQFSNGQPTQDKRRLKEKDLVEPPAQQMKQSPLGEPPRQRSQASFYDDFDEDGFK